ncbi:MAG: serine protease [Acidobacteria bacterium]|nr:serine protease [Acidobacteriota bacterium]
MPVLLRSILCLFSMLALQLAAASVCASAQARSTPPSEIAREQSPAVVVIEPVDESGRALAQGSGFIATPSGAVITNLHVVRGAARVRVKLPGGDVYQTSDLVDFDADKDIAILKIKGFRLPTVRLGDSDRAEVGEPVVVISSPEGLINSLTTGVISGVRRLETHRVFQITAPISQGSSGGAVFDSAGAVIGITTYILRSGQNINFALPINYARGMIADEPKMTLASLPQPAPVAAAAVNSDEDEIAGEVDTAARRKLGRVPHEPMFTRPDEALGFFYRMVGGVGLLRLHDVLDLTRTAALVKSGETSETERFTIEYLSFFTGVGFNFRKQDKLLESVEMLVNWSVSDLERNLGPKYKRKTIDGRTVLEYKRSEEGRLIQAFQDENKNIRIVRFLRAK